MDGMTGEAFNLVTLTHETSDLVIGILHLHMDGMILMGLALSAMALDTQPGVSDLLPQKGCEATFTDRLKAVR